MNEEEAQEFMRLLEDWVDQKISEETGECDESYCGYSWGMRRKIEKHLVEITNNLPCPEDIRYED